MATLKEQADEHAAHGKVSGTDAIRRRSFMLGAKAAVEKAAGIADARGWDATANDIRNLIKET